MTVSPSSSGFAAGTPKVAAYIDLSTLPVERRAERLAVLGRPDILGRIVTRAIVFGISSSATFPPGWAAAGDVLPEQACAWAFETAAESALPLLIVMAGAVPAAESVSALLEALTLDPLFGSALPRLSGPDGRLQMSSPFRQENASGPLRLLAALPSFQIRSESVAPCMLIRRELVGNLNFQNMQPLWTGLVDYAIRARRLGFRPVMCNRVVVPLDAAGEDVWGCEASEIERLRQRYAETGRAPVRCPSCAERLLAKAVDCPESLLIDARNLTPLFNGTSMAILGAGDALYRARPDDRVTIWLHREAEACHAIGTRYPAWKVCCEIPAGEYAAALRLSQPWHARELEELSAKAAVNVYWMLDSIAWDIGYVAQSDLDATWERLAGEADALLFISRFSRDRFANRFTCGPGVRLDTCLLSLRPADYALPVTRPEPGPPYWLVFGNHYDHKHVTATVDILSRSFPMQHLVVFGDRDQPRASRVTRFTSGQIDSSTIRGFFAGADVVIFPTFYEGFGLPIIEGLAYGRTVVTRDSSLVRELAEAYRGAGRLIVYSSERELLDVLSAIRRGEHIAEIPLVSDARAEVWGWDDVAACMLRMIRTLVAEAPQPQMLKRTGLSRGLP